MLKKTALFVIGFLLFSTLIAAFAKPEKKEDFSLGPSPFFSGLKQITFDGPRAGEGYFSADGKKMVFQSERHPGNPFYQIYLLDLESGDTELLSTGKGNTTCAWVHPNLKKAMFSSTHLDQNFDQKVKEEFEKRASPVQARYSWSYDETYDIFEVDLKTKKLKRLTKEKGYDAEGSYSPDGTKIAFASNRLGYSDQMSEDDRKIFEKDASYMMDIYIMDSDGKNVKRLTEAKGYDGGPFFSADGKKITWRRFSPNGQIAEIWTMNIDGSEQKQITRLNKMSWAPFFHPSGDYVIFGSNKEGFHNFELYVVDAEGLKEPVRVTYLEGFDGLPTFSPDGQTLSFTRRGSKGESQIYLANWDDKKIREALGLPLVPPSLAQMSPDIRAEDAETWVRYLAHESLGGRRPGSLEERAYMKALAQSFEAMGLKPAFGTSYFQEFEFTSGLELGPQTKLSLILNGKPEELRAGKDFIPLSFSKTGGIRPFEVVFAGYGLKAPGESTDKNSPRFAYDSFQGLELEGKWVLVFRDIPEKISNERRVYLNTFSRLQHKVMAAKNAGAAGVLVVNGPESSYKALPPLRFEGASATTESSLPVIAISDEVAARLFRGTGETLKSAQVKNDGGEVFTAVKLQASMAGHVDLNFVKSKAINVAARLETGRGKNRPAVVIGAHGDHLGRAEFGNSLARGDEKNLVHPGADDNASGVSAVMEIAHSLSKKNLKSDKDLVFAIWSGEEIGLLGATHFVNTFDRKIFAYLNMDMIGRYRDQLSIQSVGSAKEWKSLTERAALRTSLKLGVGEDPYLPTDSMAFYMKGIPTLHFFTGSHGEYHTPRDLPETLNYQGLAEAAKLVAWTAEQTLNPQFKLTYNKVEGSRKQMPGRSFRIFLGTIPDYVQEGVKGVKISGTQKGSPAEKAGLQAGDIITELASKRLENIYDYVYMLQALKPNQEVVMKYSRRGQEQTTKIIPELKE